MFKKGKNESLVRTDRSLVGNDSISGNTEYEEIDYSKVTVSSSGNIVPKENKSQDPDDD